MGSNDEKLLKPTFINFGNIKKLVYIINQINLNASLCKRRNVFCSCGHFFLSFFVFVKLYLFTLIFTFNIVEIKCRIYLFFQNQKMGWEHR